MGARLIALPREHWTVVLAKRADLIADYRAAIADLVKAGLTPEDAMLAVRALPRFKDLQPKLRGRE